MSQEFRLEGFLPYRLNRLGVAVSNHFKRSYAERYGLTIPEWRVLATIGQFGEAIARDIGTHSQMHKTKVSRAVRELEERRWVARREKVGNRREEYLTLTRLGKAAYEALIPTLIALESKLLNELGAQAAHELDHGLGLLEKSLGLN
jgi:DNA-binding MarR family transcriptional regulator